MFWDVETEIEGLLKLEHVPLDTLLDQPDLVSECRFSNQKLIAHICKSETIEQLVDLALIQDPPSIEVAKRATTSGDVLCASIEIAEKVLEDAALTSRFFAIFEKSTILSLQFSNVIKFLTYTFNFSTQRVVPIATENKFGEFVTNHLRSDVVVELILNLLDEDRIACREIVLQMFEAQNTIPLIISRFELSSDPEELPNIVCVLNGLLEAKGNVSVLLTPLLSVSTLTMLVTCAAESSNTAQQKASLKVLTQVVATATRQQNDTLLILIASHLKTLAANLTNPVSMPPLSMSVATPYPPLGIVRLRTIALFSLLAQSLNAEVQELVTASSLLPTIIDLFFTYIWNSFLHYTVNDLVTNILNGRCGEALLVQLVEQCNFVSRTATAVREGLLENHRPAIIGPLINMSACLEASVHPVVNPLLETPEWQEYSRRVLQQCLAKNNTPLAGGKRSQDGEHISAERTDAEQTNAERTDLGESLVIPESHSKAKSFQDIENLSQDIASFANESFANESFADFADFEANNNCEDEEDEFPKDFSVYNVASRYSNTIQPATPETAD